MLISGNVPGVRNSLVLIKTAVKGEKPRKAEELMEYEDAETVVDEVVEEVATEEVTVEETPAEETVEETTEEENTNEDAKEEEDK